MSDAAQAQELGKGQVSARSQAEQMRERIRAAADHAAQCKEAWDLAREARDELIVKAYEADPEEYTEHRIAAWARLSQPRIHGIIAAA